MILQLLMNSAGASSNIAPIVLSFGQSLEGQSCMDWSYTYPGAPSPYPTYPLPDGWTDVNPQIKIAVNFIRSVEDAVIQPPNQSPRWEDMEGSVWTGYGFRSYAYEQSFLRALQDRMNGTIYFARVMKGGVAISAFLPGGELYPGIEPLVTFAIDDLIAQGKVPQILFVHWGQGEANSGDAPSSYAANLNTFISYIRGLYPPYTDNVPFVMRKISNEQTHFSPTNINAAFDLVAAGTPACYAADPDDMVPLPEYYIEPGLSTTVHMTGPSQLQYGDPFLMDFCVDNGIIT